MNQMSTKWIQDRFTVFLPWFAFDNHENVNFSFSRLLDSAHLAWTQYVYKQTNTLFLTPGNGCSGMIVNCTDFFQLCLIIVNRQRDAHLEFTFGIETILVGLLEKQLWVRKWVFKAEVLVLTLKVGRKFKNRHRGMPLQRRGIPTQPKRVVDFSWPDKLGLRPIWTRLRHTEELRGEKRSGQGQKCDCRYA